MHFLKEILLTDKHVKENLHTASTRGAPLFEARKVGEWKPRIDKHNEMNGKLGQSRGFNVDAGRWTLNPFSICPDLRQGEAYVQQWRTYG